MSCDISLVGEISSPTVSLRALQDMPLSLAIRYLDQNQSEIANMAKVDAALAPLVPVVMALARLAAHRDEGLMP